MPPIREHASAELPKKKKREQPSISTRASRVGVTNFKNVIKSLHPGESMTYFPITKQTLQEYIDSKRKALIKAGSLEQYLQHIQAYNIALGHGWDGSVMGPIIKQALDELRASEEQAMDTNRAEYENSGQNYDNAPDTDVGIHDSNAQTTAFEDTTSFRDMFGHKTITLICYDTSSVPSALLPHQQPIPLSTLFPRTAPISFQSSSQPYVLQTLYSTISALRFPTSWGDVDTSQISYRIGTNSDAQHLALTDDAAFHRFWDALINQCQQKNDEGEESNPSMGIDVEANASLNEQNEVQLIVYRKRHTEGVPILRSIPPGKQIVICAADASLEYMLDVEHAEVLVFLENPRDVDFDEFYIKEHTYTEGKMPTAMNTINYGNAEDYVFHTMNGQSNIPSRSFYSAPAPVLALDVEDNYLSDQVINQPYILMPMQTSLSINHSDITNEPTNPGYVGTMKYFQYFNN